MSSSSDIPLMGVKIRGILKLLIEQRGGFGAAAQMTNRARWRNTHDGKEGCGVRPGLGISVAEAGCYW
jgi:hypothetical protein